MPILAALVRRSETPLGPKKRRRERWIAVAGIVDADDLGAQSGEKQRDMWSGKEAREIEHADAVQHRTPQSKRSGKARHAFAVYRQRVDRPTLYVKDELRAITNERAEARQPGDGLWRAGMNGDGSASRKVRRLIHIGSTGRRSWTGHTAEARASTAWS